MDPTPVSPDDPELQPFQRDPAATDSADIPPDRRAGTVAHLPVPIQTDSVVRGKGVLVIDDSDPTRQAILAIIKESRLFENHYEAASGAEGVKALQRNEIDLVICDVNMPGIDGLKFLGLARRHFRDIPILMLTTRQDWQTKVKSFDLGASDYVEKGDWSERGPELRARVKTHLELKKSRDQLRELASVDELTRVYNRRHFIEVMEREFSRSVRYQKPISFILLDIDHFKEINDTHGHQVGDMVLKELAGLVQTSLRGSDVVARYGGEEFAIILPETELDGAVAAAEKIRKNVARNPFPGADASLQIKVSLGVANWPRHKVTHIDQLIRVADDALYIAKESGRDKVVVAQA
ncbi:MAG: diguanylate cyclase [Nitrospirae bacterium]|nr:diguanylate cyclase [Nitrospirota bacterium]